MTRLRVAPIVEGHGEVEAIRTLLERTWREVVGGEYIEVIRAIRKPRSKLIQEHELSRAVRLAASKLQGPPATTDPMMILVLLDAEPDLPCVLGPELLNYAKRAHSGADVCCVLANVEYETWFVASADSLHEHLDLSPDEEIPQEPEESRLGKGWIQRHFKGTKYSETVDQPRMTAKMNLSQCRARSPSFDKLCRELERRLDSAP